MCLAVPLSRSIGIGHDRLVILVRPGRRADAVRITTASCISCPTTFLHDLFPFVHLHLYCGRWCVWAAQRRSLFVLQRLSRRRTKPVVRPLCTIPDVLAAALPVKSAPHRLVLVRVCWCSGDALAYSCVHRAKKQKRSAEPRGGSPPEVAPSSPSHRPRTFSRGRAVPCPRTTVPSRVFASKRHERADPRGMARQLVFWRFCDIGRNAQVGAYPLLYEFTKKHHAAHRAAPPRPPAATTAASPAFACTRCVLITLVGHVYRPSPALGLGSQIGRRPPGRCLDVARLHVVAPQRATGTSRPGARTRRAEIAALRCAAPRAWRTVIKALEGGGGGGASSSKASRSASPRTKPKSRRTSRRCARDGRRRLEVQKPGLHRPSRRGVRREDEGTRRWRRGGARCARRVRRAHRSSIDVSSTHKETTQARTRRRPASQWMGARPRVPLDRRHGRAIMLRDRVGTIVIATAACRLSEVPRDPRLVVDAADLALCCWCSLLFPPYAPLLAVGRDAYKKQKKLGVCSV